MDTGMLTTTTQSRVIDGQTVEQLHTALYDCLTLNGVLVFIDSNVITVARVYDAVCRGLLARGHTTTAGMLTRQQLDEMG